MAILDNSRVKLSRGKDKLQVFYAEIKRALDEAGEQVTVFDVESNPEIKPAGVADPRPWHTVTLYVSDIMTFSNDIGAMLGEIIYDFRCVLDYLVWDLVHTGSRKRLTAKQKREIAFPMTRSRRAFWSHVARKLPGVSSSQAAFIERYQPYCRSPAGRAIRLLQKLSNIDKHRLIIPAVVAPRGGSIRLETSGGDIVSKETSPDFFRGIKPGTKILTCTIATDEEVQVKIRGHLAWMAAFPRAIITPDAVMPSSIYVEDTLRRIAETCSEIVEGIQEHL